MNSVKLFGIAILVSAVIYCAFAEDKEELIPTCKKMMMQFAKRQLKAFSDCLKELKSTVTDKKEIAEKIHCAVKCVLDKEGLLDGEKRVTKATMQGFLDKEIPKMYHEISHELMEHCLVEFGPKMDHDDAFCTAYGDFVQCVQDVIGEIC